MLGSEHYWLGQLLLLLLLFIFLYTIVCDYIYMVFFLFIFQLLFEIVTQVVGILKYSLLPYTISQRIFWREEVKANVHCEHKTFHGKSPLYKGLDLSYRYSLVAVSLQFLLLFLICYLQLLIATFCFFLLSCIVLIFKTEFIRKFINLILKLI